jgi:hypothetical protein
MSLPSSQPKSAREAFGQSFGGRRFSGLTTGQDPDKPQRPRARLPLKLIVGVVSIGLLVSTALHIVPAMRAGMHDGMRGNWVATTQTCHRSACIWNGKFVIPGGHVMMASTHYAGQLPKGTQAGTTVPALFTGGSGLVFPAAGSDLWIGLLIALLASILGLYWASNKLVANYIRERRSTVQIPGL